MTGVLVYERAFLSPPFKFMAVAGRGKRARLPTYVTMSLRFLAEAFRHSHHEPCARPPHTRGVPLRVDAQASADGVGVGGWLPTPGADGEYDPWSSPWFSMRLTEEEVPWAFKVPGEPHRAIAGLEALVALLALVLLLPHDADSAIHVPVLATDNRGNGSVLTKLHTTKHPLSAISMEMALVLKLRGARSNVHWTPRDANIEADHLANGRTDLFDPRKRAQALFPRLRWHILDKAIKWGDELYCQSKEQLEVAGSAAALPTGRKKRQRLREREPW